MQVREAVGGTQSEFAAAVFKLFPHFPRPGTLTNVLSGGDTVGVGYSLVQG